MKHIGSEESQRIWSLKSCALISVFFAHMPLSIDGPICYLFNLLGIVGVPSFFFLSGFLDVGSCSNFVTKAQRMMIPLLFWGTITFIISVALSHGFSNSFPDLIFKWIKWVIGSGSIYYFVPVLLACMLFVVYVNEYILIAMSLLSIGLGLKIPYGDVFTAYLNPFNFILYFSLGRLYRKSSYVLKENKFLMLLSIVLVVFYLCIWRMQTPSYFNICYVPFSLVSLYLLNVLEKKINIPWLVEIGKLSFVIYLSHIQCAGFINTRMNGSLEYAKVPVAFIVMCVIAYSMKAVLTIKKEKKLFKLLGFK